MRHFFWFLFCIFLVCWCLLLSSCSSQNTSHDESPAYVVIPHHNLVNPSIDTFYKSISQEYWSFDSVVIISPNHFTHDAQTWFPIDGTYCYGKKYVDCVYGKSFSPESLSASIATFSQQESSMQTTEHGIGNHFTFLNRYFPDTPVYSLLMNISTVHDSWSHMQLQEMFDEELPRNTLYIASVDFSHHVPEKVAVFHDLRSINFLNGWVQNDIEVDCPNCLFLIRHLAHSDDQEFFNLYNRTSSASLIQGIDPFENTSHVYWSFSSVDSHGQIDRVMGDLFMSALSSNVQMPQTPDSLFGIFFGDTHFTRWFVEEDYVYDVYDHVRCFYSHANLLKHPKYWHNRMLYWFDVAGLNLETAIVDDTVCDTSDNIVNLSTDAQYLEVLASIWFTHMNIANNHSSDCLNISKTQTTEMIQSYGLDVIGWPDDSLGVKYITIGWSVFVLISWNDIGSQVDEGAVSKSILELSEKWYIPIVQMHWGYEYEDLPNERQKRLARLMVDAGARLIVWHHPHVLQDYEVYNGVPIVYSLGNFIFDQSGWGTDQWAAIVFEVSEIYTRFNIMTFEKQPWTYVLDCARFE